MGWIEQLNNDPNLSGKVDWVKVEEAHRNWDHKQQGLTPEGAAIVTLAVAWATWGAASAAGTAAGEAVTTSGVAALGEGGFVAAGGLTASSVVGGAVTAGVTALAGQASVALINNRGDIAGALNDLGSSASVKNLLTAIVTGGVLGGLNLNPTGLPTVGGGAQPFMTQLGQNLAAGAARALIGTAINGGSFEENLKEGLKGAILDTVAAQTAFAIGSARLDDFTNKVAHAVAGCAVGAARASDGCAAGAIGAVIGEISGEAFGFDENGNPKPAATQFAAMLGGIGAAIAGLDVDQINLASGAAANAAANNALKHYVDRALSKLADGLKALELKPLVEKQQLIREYLEKAGARGGLTDSEISALGVIYAANEALFPTSVLDVFPGGGKAVSKAGTLIKAGATAEDVAKVAVAESRAMREAAGEASSLANAARLRMQLKAEEVAGVPLPVEITGYSRHGLNQAISRDGAGVSPDAILDAFKNPISITGQSGGRFMLTGKDAVVVVNGQGRVITTWATGASGVRQP
ncbi:hypothetical protein A8M77_06965 [Variovorax sp. JS1663]|nr:hypothetical protein A8M77_06965 [Variovorax sp. JS1663]